MNIPEYIKEFIQKKILQPTHTHTPNLTNHITLLKTIIDIYI